MDRILGQWAVERPDLDVSPMGVIGRVHRLAARLDTELRPVFVAAGLGDGEFDVLATLRRAGAPYALTPGELASTSMVATGTVTKRVDRLERAGLVSRTVRPEDARGREVRLTEAGLALVDEVVGQHVANEHRLLQGLTAAEQRQLATLLATWGRSLGE